MAESGAACAGFCITVVTSPAPGVTHEWTGCLPPGSTVRDALQVSAAWGDLALPGVVCGVWGREVAQDHVLRDQDRVELYRALTVDPKVARRERFARQGARTTGLFARQRPGAKSGY